MKVERCPGCDAIDAAEALGSLSTVFDQAAGGQLFTQLPYLVLRCRNCKLYYKSEVAGGEMLSRYYALTDFRKWETPDLYPTEKATIDILRKLPTGSRILDYGCSSGRLLHKLIPNYECLGYEINTEAAAIAAAKGIRMLTHPTEAGRRSLDALVLVDVFEHLSQPTEAIKALADLVRPGGLIVIVTGSADAAAFQESLETSWYMRNIEHLVMLSRGYAKYLSERIGASLTDWVETSHYDYGVYDQLWQKTRRFTYRTFHGPRPAPWAPVIMMIPVLRRARHWKQPPPFSCSRDHVVTTLRMNDREIACH
jgi:SAM-dependent methyltransferase